MPSSVGNVAPTRPLSSARSSAFSTPLLRRDRRPKKDASLACLYDETREHVRTLLRSQACASNAKSGGEEEEGGGGGGFVVVVVVGPAAAVAAVLFPVPPVVLPSPALQPRLAPPPPPSTTGGSWQKSPTISSCTPPKGPSLPLATLAHRSRLSNKSACSIDISSRTSVFTSLHLLRTSSRIFRNVIASERVRGGGNETLKPAKECIVTPEIPQAPIPVVDVSTTEVGSPLYLLVRRDEAIERRR